MGIYSRYAVTTYTDRKNGSITYLDKQLLLQVQLNINFSKSNPQKGLNGSISVVINPDGQETSSIILQEDISLMITKIDALNKLKPVSRMDLAW